MLNLFLFSVSPSENNNMENIIGQKIGITGESNPGLRCRRREFYH